MRIDWEGYVTFNANKYWSQVQHVWNHGDSYLIIELIKIYDEDGHELEVSNELENKLVDIIYEENEQVMTETYLYKMGGSNE